MKDKSEFKLSENVKAVILSVSALTLLIHLYTNLFAGYGLFRDELYYIACTNRLSTGYVDQPPLSIYILAISKWIFGQSVFAIRLLPAIIAAVTVFFTGLITARLGGKITAVLIACVTLTFSPIFLAMNTFYSMNSFDQFFWVMSVYFVVRIIQNDKPVFWILLGLSLGPGMFNKISMIWFAAGLIAGLIFTPLRVHLKTRYPYIAAVITLIIFSPFVIWNFTHDFAHLEFIRNASQYKYSTLTPVDFLSGQLILPGPASILVWLPGIFYFFFNKKAKDYRILGIIFLTTFLILIINWHSKAEYLAAAYPIAFIGGGLFIEKISGRNKTGWLKFAVIDIVIISGMIGLPFALPILPVKTYISYSAVIGIAPQNSENKELSQLPQFYADMFGWEEMARTVSEVYSTIPDSEKQYTVVYASNYGEAGSMEYYSDKYELPPVVCPHNSYWYWSNPGTYKIKTVILIGGRKEDHLKTCRNVTLAAVHKTEYSMPYENNLPIFICRGFKLSLKEIWLKAKNFI